MIVEVQLGINGSREAAWAAVADIENAARIIGGIEKIEVVDRPANGLVGLRWRETRTLFGKPATVEKSITDAVENEYYRTRAEENGFVFITTMTITENGAGGVTLASTHDSQPLTFAAKLQAIPMALFFKGAVRKAILQDLNDIKGVVEG